jgi:hypothetical protein
MTGSESQILAYRTLKMKATEIILDLKTAQQAIASNWIEAYKKYVSPDPPSSRLASPAADFSILTAENSAPAKKPWWKFWQRLNPSTLRRGTGTIGSERKTLHK